MPPPRHVVRVTSVFEPPAAALSDGGVRFDPVGGMQNHTGQLTRALDRRGIVQTVVTTRPPGAPALHRLGAGAVVHRHGLPVPWARQFYALPAVRSARRAARQADLVHAHVGEDLAVLPIAAHAARSAHIPLVVTVHTSLRHTFTAAGPRSSLLKLLGGFIEARTCAAAAATIVLTPRLARYLTDGEGSVDPSRVHVIPSGVEASRYARSTADPFAPLARPRVVFVGRLARQKGVATLVEAVGLMREPASVLIVGDGPERGRLEAAVSRAGLGGRITFAGFKPHAEIPAILHHADVFAVPSLYEELGTVLIEAMAAGLPIVASRTGGIPEAVGEAARLVEPGDAAGLAAGLDAVLADRAQAARLSALALERAGAYDWSELADQVLDVYRLAVGTASEAASPVSPLDPVGA